jgi:hypothetical protein
MNNLEREQYSELSFYTLAHQDVSFIHQHIVDAQIAQTADDSIKPISIVFSLVGLFLHVEKNYTGREVQQFHLKMAENKKKWPTIIFPAKRGAVTISNVLAIPAGTERDKMIHQWCVSVWDAYKDNQTTIKNLVEQY